MCEQLREHDEDEPQRRIGEGSCPFVLVNLLRAVEPVEREREQDESQRKEHKEIDVHPSLDEMRRYLQEGPGGKHDPARAKQAVTQRDVQERRDRNQDPVEVPVVEE